MPIPSVEIILAKCLKGEITSEQARKEIEEIDTKTIYNRPDNCSMTMDVQITFFAPIGKGLRWGSINGVSTFLKDEELQQFTKAQLIQENKKLKAKYVIMESLNNEYRQALADIGEKVPPEFLPDICTIN